MTNLSGEALPPCFIFDTTSKLKDNYWLCADWTVGHPTVVGKFGFNEPVKRYSYATVRSSGCMDVDLFQKIIEEVVVPLYPDLHHEAVFDEEGNWFKGPVLFKTDTGKGHLSKTAENIEYREHMNKIGILIYLSLPNATSVTAEMDDLYSLYKPSCHIRTKKVFGGKLKDKIDSLKKRSDMISVNELQTIEDEINEDGDGDDYNVMEKVSAVINLDYSDIPVITNGIDGEPLHLRQFQNIFKKEKIRRSWSNVGFLPMTHKQLQNKKVRHELGEGTECESILKELQNRYNAVSNDCLEIGFNNVFVLDIPPKVEITRSAHEEKQIEDILQNKAAFRPSGLFLNTKNMLASNPVLIEAQRRYIQKLMMLRRKRRTHNRMRKMARNRNLWKHLVFIRMPLMT